MTETRSRYPRKVKRQIDYKRLDQGEMEEKITEKSTLTTATDEKVKTDGSVMSEEEYKEFRERMSLFLDEEDDDGNGETDEETAELMRQLEELKRRRKALKARKRKEALKAEIECKMVELKELEEQEKQEEEKKKKKMKTDKEKKAESAKLEKKAESEKLEKKTEKQSKGKDKDKGKAKEQTSKGDDISLLNIQNLRQIPSLNKVVGKQMKKLLATVGSESESDSDSDSSDNSKSTSQESDSSDSDDLYKRRHSRRHRKHKKVKSGIRDRPHDKVKIKMNWPQSELKFGFTNRKAIEFKQLTMSQFCAGELEIIRHCKISKTEREGRLSLLNKICYYANEFEWSVLLNFYAAWVKQIEKGENTWADDTSLLEVRMLIGKQVVAKTSVKFSDRSGGKFPDKSGDKKVWYCPLYQRNKCSITKEGHNLDVAGRTRYVQHICATCLRIDNTVLKHPESSQACPHMQ